MNTINHPLPGRLWVIRLSDFLAERIHKSVSEWPLTDKRTLGDQLVRAVDSISANIAEGYVRMHSKERLHFYSIARGSLEESIRHLRRARERALISRLEAYTLTGLLLKLSKGLDQLSGTKESSG
jgi:four helix bundle protein